MPLAIVRMPLPAPCRIANSAASGAPSSASRAAPTGCISAASRAESSGWTWRSRPNSSSRPPTCAGPTSAPIATAAARVAPPACSRRGRCAAIAVLTNQVTAKTKARISAARRRPARSGSCGRGAGRRPSGGALRSGPRQREIERHAEQQVQAGPGETGTAPADLGLEQRRERPADGAGEAGDQGDAGDEVARFVAVQAHQRGERGFVEAAGHADADQHPGGEHRRRARGPGRGRRGRGRTRRCSRPAPAGRPSDRSPGRRTGRAPPTPAAPARTPRTRSAR